MQKHPMLSVKEAAEALKIDERSVRDRLTNGTLKGEKKMVGLREKWFIYASALSSALAKQDDFGGALTYSNPISVRELTGQTVDATTVLVEEREDEDVQSESLDATYGAMDDPRQGPIQQSHLAGDWRADSQTNIQAVANAFMKPLLDKVAAQERAMVEQRAVIQAQEREIEEQKVQLRLLPDLEKRAREEAESAQAAELKLHEAAALQKQADLLAARAAEELAAKEAQVLQLQGEFASVEKENRVLEAKANEAQALAANLEALSQKVEDLQKPWWKKMLGG